MDKHAIVIHLKRFLFYSVSKFNLGKLRYFVFTKLHFWYVIVFIAIVVSNKVMTIYVTLLSHYYVTYYSHYYDTLLRSFLIWLAVPELNSTLVDHCTCLNIIFLTLLQQWGSLMTPYAKFALGTPFLKTSQQFLLCMVLKYNL